MYERKKHFCPSVCKYILWLSMHKKQSLAQGPHSHILMTEGGGGGGGPSDFFGPEILAKSEFLGSMKNAGVFLGREKKTGIFWVAKKGLRDFFG